MGETHAERETEIDRDRDRDLRISQDIDLSTDFPQDDKNSVVPRSMHIPTFKHFACFKTMPRSDICNLNTIQNKYNTQNLQQATKVTALKMGSSGMRGI